MPPTMPSRRPSTWSADVAAGVAVFVLCTLLMTAVGLWARYITGVFYILATAILAWNRGFRPALVATLLSSLAIGPMTLALDAQGPTINLPLRIVLVTLICLVVSWLCGNLYQTNQRLLVEQGRLRESESFHRLIGELAADFAFHARIDPQGQVIVDSATRGLTILLGYSVEELQNRPVLTLVHVDDRVRLKSVLSAAAAGHDLRGSTRLNAKNGTLVHIEYRLQTERDADGHLTGVLGAVRNTTVEYERHAALADERQALLVENTERQRVEDELRRATIEAQQRVAEAEEARAAVKDRERRLELEAQLKDEFLATLAHELRNPLASLSNASEILKREAKSDRARQASGVIDRQIAQLVRLVDDLIDVSRITRGQLTLRRERLDLRHAIQSAVETAQPQFTAAGVQLSTHMPDEPCWIDADPTRVAQVLLNLLNNAAKFTPADGRVSLQAIPEGDHVSIVVQDSGIGIAIEDQPRVFGMFVQLSADAHRQHSGLGIGLTLVKQMAELHGGTASVWSAGPDSGSTFTITLPRAEPTVDAPVAVESPVVKRSVRRVVIADDSRDGADSLCFLLQSVGHQVRTTYDGASAIRAAEEFRPDVILLDIGMPDVSGYEVARAIRREPWGQAIRLIALTGWGQAEHRRRSLEAGFDEHLVKPVELEVLEEVLEVGKRAPLSGMR